MDYEKKYNEALNWMRELYPGLHGATKEDAEHYFPELRESEDEEIRKDIIGGLMWQRDNLKSEGPHDNNLILPGFCFTVGKHLTYLEKQKEQKPAEWNNTDMKEERDNLISVCRDWEHGKKTTLLPIAAVRARYFLEHLTEPKSAEWSEEDEKMLTGIIERGSVQVPPYTTALREEQIEWLMNRLKSLCPPFKPSEEQMTALDGCLEHWTGNKYQKEILESLYEQLKKL